MNPIELSLFASRLSAVCDEMGTVLRRSALSPNIKDRLDFSCAVFNAEGELCAQAAHIPVHLGSMAFAMADIVERLAWAEGDMIILNDPFLGGTHLPDVTVIAPVFVADALVGFVANRAHHADIGAATPGSMPLSTTLHEEGLIIPPSYLLRRGSMDDAFLDHVARQTGNPAGTVADFTAQASANRVGVRRVRALVESLGVAKFGAGLTALNDYAESLAHRALSLLPNGRYAFTDVMDDDGQGNINLPIAVTLLVREGRVAVDFAGTAAQVKGNINCPLSVAAAAVFYVFRCSMPSYTPACAGTFRSIRVVAPEGSLVNAQRPAAVVAGNVETSTRIVDALLGALAQACPDLIPAASHGSMNNVAMGARGPRNWDYYETIGGGMGAGRCGGGWHGVQTHMTNTLNTPVESVEMHYPLRIRRYALRRGSGGIGTRAGGDGLVREFEFLSDATVTLLTERRTTAPWGLAGGGPGAVGRNVLNGEILPAKATCRVTSGDRLVIETPGGGGWGGPEQS